MKNEKGTGTLCLRVETDLTLDIPEVKADHTQIQTALSAVIDSSNEAIEGSDRITITTH